MEIQILEPLHETATQHIEHHFRKTVALLRRARPIHLSNVYLFSSSAGLRARRTEYDYHIDICLYNACVRAACAVRTARWKPQSCVQALLDQRCPAVVVNRHPVTRRRACVTSKGPALFARLELRDVLLESFLGTLQRGRH